MKIENNENTPLTIDEIIALAKEDYSQYAEQFKISEKKNTVVFEVDGYRHVETVDKLCWAGVNEKEVWKYSIITEDDIVQIKSNIQKPAHDKWTVAHMAEINKAFGKDVSDYALIIIYDSLEDAEKEFDEYARDEKFCRQVLDKWVFLAA